jgi:hypothetical protein
LPCHYALLVLFVDLINILRPPFVKTQLSRKPQQRGGHGAKTGRGTVQEEEEKEEEEEEEEDDDDDDDD